MVRLGIVYEIHSSKVVVLTPDSEFLVIKRSKDMRLGQQVKFNIQDVKKTMKPVYKYVSIASSVAAVFVLLFLYFRVPFYDNVYGYIGVDINPSIEFVVDKEFEVLQTKALNSDAKSIIEGLDVEGKDAYTAINVFIDKCEENGFITSKEDNIVLVSASLDDKNRRSEDIKDLDKFLIDISKKIKDQSEDIRSKAVKVSPEDREIAQKNNISMGRYYIMEKAKMHGLDMSIENLEKESISDLLAAIDKNSIIASQALNEDIEDERRPEPESTESNNKNTENEDTKDTTESVATPTQNNVSDPTVKPTAKPSIVSTPEPTKVQVIVTATPTVEVPRTMEPTQTIKGFNTAENNGRLKVRLKSIEKELKRPIISSKMHIVNTSDEDIDLRQVKLRYYFTREGRSDLEANVYSFSKASEKDRNYYEQKNISDVKVSFHNVTVSNMYMEVEFSSGVLKKDEYAYLMIDFHAEQWYPMNQSDDYSYIHNCDDYEVTNNVTAYILGKLVWGREPY